jgi:ferritin-like metal-binding protein YciE
LVPKYRQHTETEGHSERLEKVFAEIDKKPVGKTCEAIVGIVPANFCPV